MNLWPRSLKAATNTLDALLQTSSKGKAIASALLAEEEMERLCARAAGVAELTDLAAQELATIRTYEPQTLAATARVEAARRDLEQAERDRVHLLADQRQAVGSIELRRSMIQGQLTISASCVISETIVRLRALLEATYSANQYREERMLDGSHRMTASNAESVTARGAAIRRAIEAVQAFTYEAFDDEALSARCDALLAQLPELRMTSLKRASRYQRSQGDAA